MSRVLKFEVPPGKPVLRGNDHFWSVIREMDRAGEAWAISDIHAKTNGVDRSTVRDFVKRLVVGGFVETDPAGTPEQPRYHLIRNQIATPKLRRDGTVAEQGRGQVQMWNVIRGPISREGFTFKDLSLYGSTEALAIKEVTAASYVKHLAAAGYLVCVRKGRSRQPATWRLKPAMNTGPKPPLILRSQIVFDQNRNEAIGPIVAHEVEA